MTNKELESMVAKLEERVESLERELEDARGAIRNYHATNNNNVGNIATLNDKVAFLEMQVKTIIEAQKESINSYGTQIRKYE